MTQNCTPGICVSVKRIKREITGHLKAANKTYSQHLKGAMKTGAQSLFAGTTAMVHGVLPFLFETAASDTIGKIYRRQNPINQNFMKIQDVPFMTTDWSTIRSTEHKGETGMAFWRTLEIGNIRVRTVEYTPGYVADHWCTRGHVLLVMEGELLTELKDGRKFMMGPGVSYQVSSDAEPHKSSTTSGAKLFIVD